MFKFGTLCCFVGVACLYVAVFIMFGLGVKTEILRLTTLALLVAGMVKIWAGVTFWSIALKGSK